MRVRRVERSLHICFAYDKILIFCFSIGPSFAPQWNNFFLVLVLLFETISKRLCHSIFWILFIYKGVVKFYFFYIIIKNMPMQVLPCSFQSSLFYVMMIEVVENSCANVLISKTGYFFFHLLSFHVTYIKKETLNYFFSLLTDIS